MTQDTPKRFFRIYAKAPSQASYKSYEPRRESSSKQPHLRNNAQPGRSQRALQALQTAEPAWSWQIREVK